MEELKPCPFCGGEGLVEEYGRKVFLAKCTNCGVKFPNIAKTKEEAIEHWNTRVELVSHGEWVEDICCDEVIICNACGNEAYFDLDEGTYIEFDYCPFCGAKMVGEQNGTG